jgi:hypothetical protein
MRGKKNARKGERKQFITIVGNKQGILLSKQGRYRDARGSKKRKIMKQDSSEVIITTSESYNESFSVSYESETITFEFNASATYANIWGEENMLQEQAYILKYEEKFYIILVSNTRELKFKCCNCSSPSDPDSGSWCYHISLFVSLKMIYHYGEANLRQIINSSGFNLDLIVPFFQSRMVNEAGPRFGWINSFTINNSLSGILYNDVNAGAIIVYVKRGTLSLSCAFCKVNSCSHLDIIAGDPLPKKIEFSTAAQSVTSHAKPLVIFASMRYIYPMQKDHMLLCCLKKRTDMGDLWPETRFPTFEINPEMPPICCLEMDLEANLECSKALLIVRPAFRSNLKVFSYSCKSCKKITYYDGFEDGLLNCSNRFIIGLDLLYDLITKKATSGVATHAWWKAEVRAYSIHETKKYAELAIQEDLPVILQSHAEMERRLLNYSGYISALLSLFLGNIDYDRAAMVCCKNPSRISIDGIVLGVESRILKELELQRPWLYEQNSILPPTRSNTRSKMAVLNLNSNEKMTMSTFIEKGISPTELDRLAESKNTKLYMVLHIYSKTNNRGLKTPPMELVNFLKSALKSVCPVTSVMPSNVWAIVEECIRTQEISKENQLIIIQRSPVLLGFLQLYNSTDYENKWNIELINYLEELLMRSKKHFDSTCNNY